jgi:hypothetical protein
MSWMNFTGDDHAASGMEFSTPFDISHRETVEMNPLFETQLLNGYRRSLRFSRIF